MRRPGRRPAALLAAVLAATLGLGLAACGSPAAGAPDLPALVHVVNVDGPARVELRLNGEVVGLVSCGADLTLEPGVGALPSLPWSLDVFEAAGGLLRTVELTGDLPLGVLVRGRSVLIGPWPMSFGPAPSPLDAPCAEAG